MYHDETLTRIKNDLDFITSWEEWDEIGGYKRDELLDRIQLIISDYIRDIKRSVIKKICDEKNF